MNLNVATKPKGGLPVIELALPALYDRPPKPDMVFYVRIKNQFDQLMVIQAFSPPTVGETIQETILELVLQAWEMQPMFLKEALRVVDEKVRALFTIVAYNAETRILTVRLLDQ